MERFILTAGRFVSVSLCVLWTLTSSAAQRPLTIATYNIENYLLAPSGGRAAKTEESKRKVVEALRRLSPDVVALEEVGGREALEDLRSRLAQAGGAYPYVELAPGHDPYIQMALLSRAPILARRSQTNLSYVWMGRRFFVGRAFLEVDLRVDDKAVTVIAAHLKSRREILDADQAELREQEARLLRRQIDQRLTARPDSLLAVLGDFNDTQDSKPIRGLIGRGSLGLADLRPLERSLDCAAARGPGVGDARSVAWTHYYGREDSYSRVDYILASRAMQRLCDREGTYVAAFDGWGVASDHRPVIARFQLPIRGE
ncbi:MAG: endonuclease/exonuclease/phosphatase family protein [Verrucomicrobia bacterium]|nr:endonuclease/exonuclease/phosphatase family protein [Verrucomicrobiota bacterium]MBI3868357.1 endonuclease/exonuclease/phosphatase family protein [Verrucomicrobiota bacterium]